MIKIVEDRKTTKDYSSQIEDYLNYHLGPYERSAVVDASKVLRRLDDGAIVFVEYHVGVEIPDEDLLETEFYEGTFKVVGDQVTKVPD